MQINEKATISRNYKNTQRATPSSISEIFGNLSSSLSNETPSTKIMQSSKTDGLVTMDITFKIGANKDDKVVLIPTVRFVITGMDEARNNKSGTYAQGHISYKQGIPFDGDRAKKDPQYLSQILNIDSIISCFGYMLDNLKAKEISMGYDAIWNIGE